MNSFKKKLLSILIIMSVIMTMNTSIANASDSIPTDMPFLYVNGDMPLRNSFGGTHWLGHANYTWTDKNKVVSIKNQDTGGVYQWRYIDHIDVRVDNAKIKINYYENGVFQSSRIKNAEVKSVSDILINGNKQSYYSTGNKRKDGVVQEDEFNFQIIQNNDFDKYQNKWLNLTNVYSITIIATLVVEESDGTKTEYKDVHFIIEGQENIVKLSDCSNASGLDYHLAGDITENIIVEIPTPDPVPPEIVPPEVDLIPNLGDTFNINNVIVILFVFLAWVSFLVFNNKKRTN